MRRPTVALDDTAARTPEAFPPPCFTGSRPVEHSHMHDRQAPGMSDA